MTSKNNLFEKIITVLHRIEDYILIGILLLMIIIAVLQIVLRNFFDSGILWADPFVKVLVLWVGLLGAMVATRNNNHISIDLISRYLPNALKKITSLIVTLFAAVVCGVMTWLGLGFVIMEKQDGINAFGSVPAWICEAIIPIAFSIISLRYIIMSITRFSELLKKPS